ncbi:hypothetical protein BX600DRAFT_457610 [Xylariales sp. PMI_506]|nr:hypothetical protein BX600DRAFT_457610 [Xylariales sp. PMI_506]
MLWTQYVCFGTNDSHVDSSLLRSLGFDQKSDEKERGASCIGYHSTYQSQRQILGNISMLCHHLILIPNHHVFVQQLTRCDKKYLSNGTHVVVVVVAKHREGGNGQGFDGLKPRKSLMVTKAYTIIHTWCLFLPSLVFGVWNVAETNTILLF